MNNNLENNIEDIQDIDVSKEMRASFLSYAISVLKSRAIPDVRDGLKPVHRRIIYAMHELGVFHDKSFKKAARIVGEVIGKYHPHGDTAIYETMVRMAQDFSLRYPLIQGQGNFGSIDGDPAAAMRYTELRMSKIASALIFELNKDTVNFINNYDDSEREPVILPSYFPNLLVNGTSGIAVSMATNIPSHNLREVIDALIVVLKHPNITVEELVNQNIIKGPDFPTAGVIIGTQAIRKAYLTSKGNIIIRSKVTEEQLKNGHIALVITQIPYQTNKLKLVEKLEEVRKEKKVDGILKVQDESGRKGIRIVIELKKDANAKLILNKLYKLTQLQISFAMNLVALDKNGPSEMNLLQLIQGYLSHQYEILVRKTKFELLKSQEKAHLAKGIITALKNINEVVDLIKKAKNALEAINGLQNKFQLSLVQAQAILQMRLQRLTGLEQEKIEHELVELEQLITQLNYILENPNKQTELIIEQLTKIKEQFGDARRTEIVFEELEIEEENINIPNEKVAILLSQNGYIKRLNIEEYRTQKRGGVGVNTMNLNDTDDIAEIIIANTHDDILFFSDLGKVYVLKAYEISNFSRFARGTPIINLINIEQNEKIKAMLKINKESSAKYLFFVTKNGLIKRTKISEFASIRKSGKIAIDLKENDCLIDVLLTNGNNEIIIASNQGKAVRFFEKNIRVLQRKATGIIGIEVKGEQNFVIGACSNVSGSNVLLISENGFGKITNLQNFRLTKRGAKGVKALNITLKTGNLQVIKTIKGDEEVLLINDDGIVIRVNLDTLKTSQRNSSGVRLIKLKKNQKIKTVAVIKNE